MPPGVQIIPTFLLGSGADSIMDVSSWAAISSALQSWNETEGIAFYSVAEDQAAKSSTGQYTTDTFCSFLYDSSHGEHLMANRRLDVKLDFAYESVYVSMQHSVTLLSWQHFR